MRCSLAAKAHRVSISETQSEVVAVTASTADSMTVCDWLAQWAISAGLTKTFPSAAYSPDISGQTGDAVSHLPVLFVCTPHAVNRPQRAQQHTHKGKIRKVLVTQNSHTPQTFVNIRAFCRKQMKNLNAASSGEKCTAKTPWATTNHKTTKQKNKKDRACACACTVVIRYTAPAQHTQQTVAWFNFYNFCAGNKIAHIYAL